MSLTQCKTNTYNDFRNNTNLAQLCSKVDILYFYINSESVILSCNSTAQESLEFENDEWVGKKFLDLVPIENQPSILEQIHLCFDRGYIRSLSAVLFTQSGKRLDVMINGLGTPHTNGDEPTAHLYVRDITAQALSERHKALALRILRKMQESESHEQMVREILSDIQRSLPADGIGVSLEKATGEKQCLGNWRNAGIETENANDDFRRWATERWKRLLELMQANAAEQLTHSGGCYIRSVENLAATVVDSELRFMLRCLGNYQSLVVLPLPLENRFGFLLFSESRPAPWSEEEIHFLESLAHVFDMPLSKPRPGDRKTGRELDSPLFRLPYMGTVQTRNGMIERSNPWVQNLLGYEAEALSGKTLLEFVDPEHHAALLEIQSVALSNPGSIPSAQVRIWTHEGRLRTVHCSVETPDPANPNEQLWYWTELADQEDGKKQLLRTRKMEVLGMLAGSIVLDFNNQLACILGNSSLLSEEIPPTNPHYPELQQIIATTEKAVELTARLLACAQGSPYWVDDLDVNPLINEVAGILSKTFAKDLLIRAELDPQIERIQADASQIQQIFMEIALNAKGSMPNGGKIVFQTRNVTLSETDIRLRKAAPGRYIQITVSDTGHGLTHDAKRQVMETGQDNEPQDLIGLAMIRPIVEKHHGFLSVFSEKGQGTVFKIHFPVAVKDTKQGSSRYAGNLTGGHETILLVENETILRETGVKMLNRYGYQVIPANSGTEALDLFRKYTDRIDLVIVDAMLPGIEINKVLEWMYKLNPRTKVIAAVGMGERDAVERQLRFEINGFVQKPFRLRPLIQHVRSTLNA
jgi:PAS domain S-box-containing protein